MALPPRTRGVYVADSPTPGMVRVAVVDADGRLILDAGVCADLLTDRARVGLFGWLRHAERTTPRALA